MLSCINGNSVLEFSGNYVQTLYDHILEILPHTIQFYVPLEFSSESIRKPSQLSKLLKEKLNLYHKSKNDFSLVLDSKAKSRKYNRFYSYINKKMNVRTSILILKSEDGHLICTDEDKAMLFNSVFQKVFTVDNGVNWHLNSDLSYHKHLQDFEITTSDVVKALPKLNSFMSRSPDNIPAYFLKQVCFTLVDISTHLLNLFLSNGVIPNQWKQAIITSIYKKDSHNQLLNCRHILLTSVMCHILEIIIADKIRDHQINNNLLSDSWFEFYLDNPHVHNC